MPVSSRRATGPQHTTTRSGCVLRIPALKAQSGKGMVPVQPGPGLWGSVALVGDVQRAMSPVSAIGARCNLQAILPCCGKLGRRQWHPSRPPHCPSSDAHICAVARG
eukprot:scaffold92116_cov29-Tisochrysis_lutea.AAC.9